MLLKKPATFAREHSIISSTPILSSDPFTGPSPGQTFPRFSDPSSLLSRSSTPVWDMGSMSSASSARLYSNKLPLLLDQKVALAVFKPLLQSYTMFKNLFPGPVDLQTLWFGRMPTLMEHPPSYCDGSLLREVGNLQNLLTALLILVDTKDPFYHPEPSCGSCEHRL